MSDKQELKPCPFCESTSHGWHKQYNHEVERDGMLYKIFCHRCGAACRSKKSEAEAITAWNHRPASPAPSKAVADAEAKFTTYHDVENSPASAFTAMLDLQAANAALTKQVQTLTQQIADNDFKEAYTMIDLPISEMTPERLRAELRSSIKGNMLQTKTIANLRTELEAVKGEVKRLRNTGSQLRAELEAAKIQSAKRASACKMNMDTIQRKKKQLAGQADHIAGLEGALEKYESKEAKLKEIRRVMQDYCDKCEGDASDQCYSCKKYIALCKGDIEGFTAALAQSQPVTPWVSVEDDKPKHEQQVWVSDGKDVYKAKFCDGDHKSMWFGTGITWEVDEAITHWRIIDLPIPPTPEKRLDKGSMEE